MSHTGETTKKRPAESDGGPPNPKQIRPPEDAEVILGLGTEEDLRTRASELWKTFQPKINVRTQDLGRLMTNGKAPFLPGPMIDNTVELLKFAHDNTVGAIVSGHKMAGKSQTLQFVEHVLRSYGCGVLKFSITDREGSDKMPSTEKEFLRSLVGEVLNSNECAIERACWCLLHEVLRFDGVDEASKLEYAENHYKASSGVLPRLGQAEAGQLAMVVLQYINVLRDRDEFTKDEVLELIGNLFGLLTHDDIGKHLLRPCVLIVDEVGDMLNSDSGLTGEAQVVADTYIRPLIDRLSEQIMRRKQSRFFVLVAGSRSVASYVQKKHLERFHFFLKSFDAADCVALWEMWKTNLKDIEAEKLVEAEQWLLDVAPCAESTLPLGAGVLMRTDGVPGYMTELFCNAIGKEANSKATLSWMVKRCFEDLVKELTLTGETGAKVALRRMDQEKWVKFAEFGLTPSADRAPSAPVLSLLFDLLRPQMLDAGPAYTSMLKTMANLKLSGSFTGAVYQEQVLNSVLQGETIFARSVDWSATTSTWQQGAQTELITGKPCTCYVYQKSGGGLRTPVHFGHATLNVIDQATAKQNPAFVVFYAESQIFPSIDFTMCIKTKGTGGETDALQHGADSGGDSGNGQRKARKKKQKAATTTTIRTRSAARQQPPVQQPPVIKMYHCSVSIDTLHFAKACTAEASGHLPLKIDDDPPSLLRSDRSKKQVAAYCATLLEHEWVKGCTVEHHYAVFDDHATDLLSPTPTFKDTSYMILSTTQALS